MLKCFTRKMTAIVKLSSNVCLGNCIETGSMVPLQIGNTQTNKQTDTHNYLVVLLASTEEYLQVKTSSLIQKMYYYYFWNKRKSVSQIIHMVFFCLMKFVGEKSIFDDVKRRIDDLYISHNASGMEANTWVLLIRNSSSHSSLDVNGLEFPCLATTLCFTRICNQGSSLMCSWC